jgi:hypothetical protein
MDFVEELLDRLKEIARRIIDSLLGPEPQPEAELIPIPVNDRPRSRY